MFKTLFSSGLDAITKFGQAQEAAADRHQRSLQRADAKRSKAQADAREQLAAANGRADAEHHEAEQAAWDTFLRDQAAARKALAASVPGSVLTLNGLQWELRKDPADPLTPPYAITYRQGESWVTTTPVGTAFAGDLTSALALMYRSFVEAYPDLVR